MLINNRTNNVKFPFYDKSYECNVHSRPLTLRWYTHILWSYHAIWFIWCNRSTKNENNHIVAVSGIENLFWTWLLRWTLHSEYNTMYTMVSLLFKHVLVQHLFLNVHCWNSLCFFVNKVNFSLTFYLVFCLYKMACLRWSCGLMVHWLDL